MTLTAVRTDADHVPCVLIRGGYSIHQNQSGEIQMSDVAYTIGTTANASARQTPLVLVLNDQGGAVMNVSYDSVGTLRAQDHGHPPLVYDARGNGGVMYARR